jgi:hypothetical protein
MTKKLQRESKEFNMTEHDIIEHNMTVVEEYFVGLVSGKYYTGQACYHLCLDARDHTLDIIMTCGSNQFTPPLFRVLVVSGRTCMPEDELYNEDRGDDLHDFGFQDWVEHTLEPAIADTLSTIKQNYPEDL